MPKKKTLKGKKKGGKLAISRQAAYNKVAVHFDEILETQLYLMRHAAQESVRASMANKLMDKILPNLQAQDITSDGGKISFEWKVNKS